MKNKILEQILAYFVFFCEVVLVGSLTLITLTFLIEGHL